MSSWQREMQMVLVVISSERDEFMRRLIAHQAWPNFNARVTARRNERGRDHDQQGPGRAQAEMPPPLFKVSTTLILHAGRPELVAREMVELVWSTCCVTSVSGRSIANLMAQRKFGHTPGNRTPADTKGRQAVSAIDWPFPKWNDGGRSRP